MQHIIIIGNSITADIIYSYVKDDTRYKVCAFAVDKEFISDTEIDGLPVVDLNNLSDHFPADTHQALMAIGYQKLNETRASIFQRLKDMGYEPLTYLHKGAHIHTNNIGAGSVVLPGSVIEPFVTIGENNIIWANCTIGHHVHLGNHNWVASGTVLAGEAKLADRCFLGVNTTIANKVSIAADNLIGAHTSIQKDTKENEVYLSRQGEKHRFPAKDYAEHLLK